MYKLTSPLDGFRSPFGAQRGGALQRIIALFSDPAATGWVYDNQDLRTMFQDVDGTVPVTAPGQRVRLQLDKSGKGNHRRQPSGDASAPILGRHPAGGRRNLLTWTEDFSNAAWAKIFLGTGTLPTVTPGRTDPDGGTSAWRLQANAGAGTAASDYSVIRQVNAPSYGGPRSIWIKSNTGSDQTVYFGNSTNTIRTVIATPVWRRVELPCPIASTLTDIGAYPLVSPATAIVDIDIWRPQAELGATATPYQRVTIADDCTEAGVADRWYLRADGADDWLETSAFAWGSDKATICAGVRKLSDAAAGVVVETSDNKNLNNGSFVLTAPETTNLNGNFAFTSRGTINVAAPPSSGVILAPATRVLSGIAEISSDTRILRVNGTQVAQGTGDQGTGNFGTYPAYFFRRGGSSLPFNGFEYANIGINRLLTPADLALVEGYVTGVTL